jgi:hypothetical protein
MRRKFSAVSPETRPIGLVDRRSRLRPPGSQGGSLRGDPNCLTVNALATAPKPHAGEGVTLYICPSAQGSDQV